MTSTGTPDDDAEDGQSAAPVSDPGGDSDPATNDDEARK